MLRIAACLATERGVQVCAPVHDALLIEAPLDGLEQAVTATRAAMAESSRAVLDGLELKTDVSVVKWPGRYSDPRGMLMWQRVTGILETIKDGDEHLTEGEIPENRCASRPGMDQLRLRPQ